MRGVGTTNSQQVHDLSSPIVLRTGQNVCPAYKYIIYPHTLVKGVFTGARACTRRGLIDFSTATATARRGVAMVSPPSREVFTRIDCGIERDPEDKDRRLVSEALHTPNNAQLAHDIILC